jgi:hypothetical protein
MPWTPRLAFAAAVLLLAYAAWPLLGLKTIADAVEARDAATIMDRLDAPELKRSLTEQLVRTYLKVTGKDQGLSPLAFNLAMRVGIGIAEPMVAEMMLPAALIALLKQSRTETFAASHVVPLEAWSAPNLRNLRGLLLGTEYAGQNFYVTVPLYAESAQGYRLRLKFSQWRWKLAGIELPEEVRVNIAREILRRNPT